MSLNTPGQIFVEDATPPAPPQVITVPEAHREKVEAILEYTKSAFTIPFEFTLQPGVEGSFWLVGPYGTFIIALGVHPDGQPDLTIDTISVSLESEPHFAAVTTHTYATKFGLVYMDPHCQGVGENQNDVVFGKGAHEAKAIIDESRLRAKVVELTQEAARQVAEDNKPTLADKIMGGPKPLIDAHGRVLK